MRITTIALTSLAAILAAGCVGDPGQKRKPGDDDPTAEGECKRLESAVTIRDDKDFDKLDKDMNKACWDLFGTLRIEGAAIKSLSRLGKLQSVNDLEIVNTGLTTLDVTQPIDVWGSITVSNNPSLTSLGQLQIENADDLTTSYTVRGNPQLIKLGGLDFVTAVEGELRIADNAKLTEIKLTQLDKAGAVVIANNGITALDLGGLHTVGRIEISGNTALTTITPPAAATIQGDLTLRGNRALASLGTWLSVSSIAGALAIDDNDALTTLSGFAGLRTVGGAVAITNNAALTDISTVSHLQSIGLAVLVTYNPQLSNCRALEIDHCVQSGPVTFNNNKPNTNSCGDCWCE